MKLLSRSEEIILLTILKLKDNSYGVAIRELIFRETGSKWSFGSIYMPLNKLTRRGYVKKTMGDPTPERGGRSKCLYEITERGLKALRKIKGIQESVWENVSDTMLKTKKV